RGEECGVAAVGGQQPSQGLGGGVIDQPPRQRRHDQGGGLGGPGDRLRLAFFLLVNGGFAGRGFGLGGGLVGDAPQSNCLGDRREGSSRLLAFEVGNRA